MSEYPTAQTQTIAKPTITPVASGLLQRQCACGQHTSAGEECEACKQKREGTLQRAAIQPSSLSPHPSEAPLSLRPGQPQQMQLAASQPLLSSNGGAVHTTRQLQRAVGNQALQRPLNEGEIQAKLSISQPGDIYEQEADRVSEQVMRLPEPQLQRACACGGGYPKCQTEQRDQKHRCIQTKPVGPTDLNQVEVPCIVHDVLRSSGQPLDPTARSFMESRFGHDFSRVRVHSDTKAAESAQAVNALAYTMGRHVVFGGNRYRPETSQGRQLLAHELTHVLQQESPHSQSGLASISPVLTTPSPLLQMQRESPWEGVVETEEEPLMLRATPEVSNPPHLNSMGLLAKGTHVTVLSGSKFGWMKVRGITTEGLAKTGFVVGKYIGVGASIKPSSSSTPPAGGAPTRSTAPPISVDGIKIVTDTTDAETGFSGVVGKSDQNKPGPFNDPATGEVTNVHQIHFHLDNGNSSNVRPIRKVKATWSYGSGASRSESKLPEDKQPPPGSGRTVIPGGYGGTRYEDDGPPDHEVLRPVADKIAVADIPGIKGLGSWYQPYPFKMDSDFELTLWSKVGPPLARVNYSVFIEKKDDKNIPNERNELIAGKKKDLVRDRELTT